MLGQADTRERPAGALLQNLFLAIGDICGRLTRLITFRGSAQTVRLLVASSDPEVVGAAKATGCSLVVVRNAHECGRAMAEGGQPPHLALLDSTLCPLDCFGIHKLLYTSTPQIPTLVLVDRCSGSAFPPADPHRSPYHVYVPRAEGLQELCHQLAALHFRASGGGRPHIPDHSRVREHHNHLQVPWAVAAVVATVSLVCVTSWAAEKRLNTLPGAEPVSAANQAVFSFSIPLPGEPTLKAPLAVAETLRGDILVADTGNGLVRIYKGDGHFSFSLGEGTKDGQGALSYPVGVTTDPSGRIYVSDLWLKKVLTYAPGGQYLGDFGDGRDGSLFGAPGGILYHKGLLYVTDLEAHRVLVLDDKGRLVRSLGDGPGARVGQLQYPNYVAVNDMGDVFVSDSNNNRVQVFDPLGGARRALSEAARGQLLLPRGLAIDPSSRLHVASAFGHYVQVIDAWGNPLFNYGMEGSGDGEMRLPNGLFISGRRVLVADRGNNRVQVWSLEGR